MSSLRKNHQITVASKASWQRVLTFLLLFCFAQCKTTQPVSPVKIPDVSTCDHLPEKGDPEWRDWPMERLSAYLKAIREEQPECSKKFNSDMQKAYVAFQEYLPEDLTWNEAMRILGSPDYELSVANLRYFKPPKDEVIQQAEKDINEDIGVAYTIYFWRDWHDYFYLKFNKGKLVKSGMYYAYE